MDDGKVRPVEKSRDHRRVFSPEARTVNDRLTNACFAPPCTQLLFTLINAFSFSNIAYNMLDIVPETPHGAWGVVTLGPPDNLWRDSYALFLPSRCSTCTYHCAVGIVHLHWACSHSMTSQPAASFPTVVCLYSRHLTV